MQTGFLDEPNRMLLRMTHKQDRGGSPPLFFCLHFLPHSQLSLPQIDVNNLHPMDESSDIATIVCKTSLTSLVRQSLIMT